MLSKPITSIIDKVCCGTLFQGAFSGFARKASRGILFRVLCAPKSMHGKTLFRRLRLPKSVYGKGGI